MASQALPVCRSQPTVSYAKGYAEPLRASRERESPGLSRTHPLPPAPPIVMTPTVFSGLDPILALKMVETASLWASKPGRARERERADVRAGGSSSCDDGTHESEGSRRCACTPKSRCCARERRTKRELRAGLPSNRGHAQEHHCLGSQSSEVSRSTKGRMSNLLTSGAMVREGERRQGRWRLMYRAPRELATWRPPCVRLSSLSRRWTSIWSVGSDQESKDACTSLV